MTSDYEILSETEGEVSLFDLLPETITSGTAFDYYANYPFFFEEVYYLLECASRENREPGSLVKLCQTIVKERNELLTEKFESARTTPDELLLDFDENFDYSYKGNVLANPSISELQHSD